MRTRLFPLVTLCVTLMATALFAAPLGSPATAQSGGTTSRLSRSSTGQQGDGQSAAPSVSADGRFVAFNSLAGTLVSGDTNGVSDIFVHDRQTSQTSRVSLSSGGAQANGHSYWAALSADGRYVGFLSDASNLVSGDTNGVSDIFVHDRQTGQTTRVSVSTTGAQGNDEASLYFGPSLSADGRFATFESLASNLVSGDTNGLPDIFVHDRQAGQTTRVSVSSTGAQTNLESYEATISGDGRFVVFLSHADNLVSGDTNDSFDVFLHDRQTGQTTRESVSSTGVQNPVYSYAPSLSADGRFVVFHTHGWTLVPDDTNSWEDVFVRDRVTGQVTRVSVASDGFQANNGSFDPAISDDGNYVTFYSLASNLVSGDTNNTYDIFIHHRPTGATTRISVASAGTQSNDSSWMPDIAAGGRFVAFYSYASNLVSGDTNGVSDVFGHDMGSGPPPTPQPTATPPSGCGLAVEDFNAGSSAFPPAGWSVEEVTPSACLWESSEAGGRLNRTGGDGFAAIGDASACGLGNLMNTALRTPSFSLAGATAPVLSYRYDYFDTNTSDQGYVDISTDGGHTWTKILANLENLRGPNREVVDLSGYVGEPNITLRFRYVVPDPGGWFQVDDVAVACESALDAVVAPTAVAVTLPPDAVRAETVSIVNAGETARMLLWWLNEEAAARAERPVVRAEGAAGTGGAGRTESPSGPKGGALVEQVGAVVAPEAAPRPSALGLASDPYIPENLLYDNGPLLNSPDTGVEGADESVLEDVSLPMNILGFGHQVSAGHRVADDFTISDPGGWQVDTITFYAFQTLSGPTSTFTSVNYRIWDGPPGAPGSSVIFGDTTTNRLINTVWTGVNRVSAQGDDVFPRPIMANTVSAGLLLPPGTYWLDWQSDGTLGNGPWAPPIALHRHAPTGDALQFNAALGTWGPARDHRADIPQGFPFTIEGDIVGGADCAAGDIAWLTTLPTSGSTRAGSTDVLNNTEVELTFNTAGLAPGTYTGTLCIETNIPTERLVTVPLSMTVAAVPAVVTEPATLASTQATNETVTQTLTLRNVGQLDLNWTLTEETAVAARGEGAPAYGFDLFHRQLVAFTTDAPETLTPIVGYGTDVYWVGGDFLHADFSTLYALDLFNNRFAAFNTTTGEMTTLGFPEPEADQLWNGMANDPTSDTLYANSTNWAGANQCTGSRLYTLDPASGTATPIGPITGATCVIGLAANAQGELYGLDIVLDALVRINKATGAATVIGPLGYDADFSQGMDFDEQSGTLYLAAYNTNTAHSELRVANLATGATTPVGLLGTPAGSGWLGTMAVATARCTPAALPWLTVNPTSGTTTPGGSTAVQVTFDSSGLAPGTYTGALCLASNDPARPSLRIPVTLVVAGGATPTPTTLPSATVTPSVSVTATATRTPPAPPSATVTPPVPLTATVTRTPTAPLTTNVTPHASLTATVTRTPLAPSTATATRIPTAPATATGTVAPTTSRTPTVLALPSTTTPPAAITALYLPLIRR